MTQLNPIKIGSSVPDAITLPDDSGKNISLKEYLGHFLVVYFYPKDDTPGCTTEACSFRDIDSEIMALGVKIVGVSKDSVASHQKFKTKYNLPFPLLADTEHQLADAFGVWGEKKFMGKTYEGMLRATFVIDPAGKVIQVWDKVKTTSHADEVLEFLKKTLESKP